MRKPFTPDIYNAVHSRDKVCQKCGRDYSLQIHHIVPVFMDGTNDLDNLILLCVPCHNEWESVESANKIPFSVWLPLPPLELLLSAFIRDNFKKREWPDNFSAKEWQEVILLMHSSKKELSKQHD